MGVRSFNNVLMKQLGKNEVLENPGIDPGTSHMLSERSTT